MTVSFDVAKSTDACPDSGLKYHMSYCDCSSTDEFLEVKAVMSSK